MLIVWVIGRVLFACEADEECENEDECDAVAEHGEEAVRTDARSDVDRDCSAHD